MRKYPVTFSGFRTCIRAFIYFYLIRALLDVDCIADVHAHRAVHHLRRAAIA